MGITETEIYEAFVKWQAGELTDAEYAAVVRGKSGKPAKKKGRRTQISGEVPKDDAPSSPAVGKITWAHMDDGAWGVCWEDCPYSSGASGMLVTARRKDGAAKEVTLGDYTHSHTTKDGRHLHFYRVKKATVLNFTPENHPAGA